MRLDQCLLHPPAASSYVVAYSGGLDSTVLLHLAHAQGLPGLQAIHVHHGLQPAADGWAQQAEQQCQQWGVPLKVLRVAVDAQHPQGPEAGARQARYDALRAQLKPGAVLVTAHHASDQAETVLLRLLRGTGVEGIAAMRTLMQTHTNPLWRPMLVVPKAALRAYAQQHQLQWIEDPHNTQSRYARSWLRSAVMPLLHQRWPDVDAQLVRAASHAADAAELLAGLAVTLLPTVQRSDGGLSVSGLLALSDAQQRLLLRHWLSVLGLPSAPSVTLRAAQLEVLGARADADPLLIWPGGEFRRYRDAFYASVPLPAVPVDFSAAWDGCAALALPETYGSLHAEQPLPMQVCFAPGGERIKPAGDAHTRTLRQLAQQAGVPPWLRRRLPLVFVENKLVSVAGIWNAQAAPKVQWQIPAWPGNIGRDSPNVTPLRRVLTSG